MWAVPANITSSPGKFKSMCMGIAGKPQGGLTFNCRDCYKPGYQPFAKAKFLQFWMQGGKGRRCWEGNDALQDSLFRPTNLLWQGEESSAQNRSLGHRSLGSLSINGFSMHAGAVGGVPNLNIGLAQQTDKGGYNAYCGGFALSTLKPAKTAKKGWRLYKIPLTQFG